MKTCIGLNKQYVSLYAMILNLNCFAVIIHIFTHVIIRVTYILRINDLGFNVQFNIWYHDKMFCCVKLHNFR